MYTRAVEVLYAYQESRPGRTREQPRQKRCPEVPEVELARGARREASIEIVDASLTVSIILSRQILQSEPESTTSTLISMLSG